MTYRCEVCTAKSQPKEPLRRFIFYRSLPYTVYSGGEPETKYRTEIAREVPVCHYCEVALGAGESIASLAYRRRPKVEAVDPVKGITAPTPEPKPAPPPPAPPLVTGPLSFGKRVGKPKKVGPYCTANEGGEYRVCPIHPDGSCRPNSIDRAVVEFKKILPS